MGPLMPVLKIAAFRSNLIQEHWAMKVSVGSFQGRLIGPRFPDANRIRRVADQESSKM